jgi:hypothetical protein
MKAFLAIVSAIVLAAMPTVAQSQTTTRTVTVTRDCLLNKDGNRTTDCIVVPNGTTKPRDPVRGTKEETFTPPALPSDGKGPFVFGSKNSCLSALRTGSYRYYEPKFLGARNKNPVDGEKRKVAPLEWDRCVHMHVVGGKKWVVQKEGTLFRYNVRADGKLEDVPYEHDACGNEVYGMADLPTEKRTVPGEWTHRYGIFVDEEVETPAVTPRTPVVRERTRVVCVRCCNPCCYRGSWGERYYGGYGRTRNYGGGNVRYYR